MNTLFDLLIFELDEVLSTAEYLLKILKRMSSLATHPELVSELDAYEQQGHYQIKTLNDFFRDTQINIEHCDCLIMKMLRDHSLESMRYQGSMAIRDLALIVTLNSVKHFEQTVFGTLLTQARVLGKEEIIDMLTSIKQEIAEGKKTIEIATAILNENQNYEFKKEVKELLNHIVYGQVRDEQMLLDFLPQLMQEVKSTTLYEALETYLDEHKNYLGKLNSYYYGNGIKPVNWSVMEGFIDEWKRYLQSMGSATLKDIGVILSVQRIQHQNMAVYELGMLLSVYFGDLKMHQFFKDISEREIGNDQSFSAIAEGSLFEKGLDSKVTK